MGSRVLTSGGATPGRMLVADAQGNGDYETIQAAIDAALAQTPSASDLWTVLVAPGLYQENLTLYDYIDVIGDGPSDGVRIAPTSGPAIGNGAHMTLANLKLGGVASPIFQTGSSFSGTMRLRNLIMEGETAEIDGLAVASGTVLAKDCELQAGGAALVLTGGVVKVSDSTLRHYHATAGAATEAAIEVSAGALHVIRCLVENTSPLGPGVDFLADPTEAKFLHSVIRKASGSYAVDADVAVTAYIADCIMNGAVNSLVTGLVQYTEDANL